MIVTDEQVAQRLLVMSRMLRTYGRLTDAEVAGLWLAILQRAEVTGEEWLGATHHWLETEGDYPTPSDILRIIKAARKEAFDLRWESRQTVELPDGTIRLMFGEDPALEAK